MLIGGTGSIRLHVFTLVAMAETLANRGTVQDGNEFIATYRSKYPRHSAFKKELNSASQESVMQREGEDRE